MEPLTPDRLFHQWFWPHYPPEARRDLSAARARDANPGGNPSLAQAPANAAGLFVANAPELLGVHLTVDDAGVLALARALDRPRRDRWLAAGDPADAGNVFFNTVVHGALFVGEACVTAHGGRWSLRNPLWESLVHRRGGGAFAPFHWLLKALSDDAVDEDTLAWRWQVHVVLADAEPERLPPIATGAPLPRLKTPTYDLLVKYLQQHLPALRDLGAGFPSPELFTRRAYRQLSFEVLHDARVLCAHGQQGPDGDHPHAVDLLWLTASGLHHEDTVPSDEAIPYFARALDASTVEVTVRWKNRPGSHRLGLRGHR
jgi:hypothetical protein